jgi:hypothetical protein
MGQNRFKTGDLVDMQLYYVKVFSKEEYAGVFVVVGFLADSHVKLMMSHGRIMMSHVDYVTLVQSAGAVV